MPVLLSPIPCTMKDCTVIPVMEPVMGNSKKPPPPRVRGMWGMVRV